jgi:hypothetical protein
MASQAPFPLMPPKSTELRMAHFDEHVYTADSTTTLYKFLDALCGDGGAGNLKKELFLQRLSAGLDGIYGSALDFIFGGTRFLSRVSSESYSFNTEIALLTSAQWDEVAVKDAAYRARIREFFAAATKGGTPEAIRLAVHAATSADCQVMESWRYIDNFGLAAGVGRALITNYAAVNLITGHQVFFFDQNENVAKGFAEGYITALPVDQRTNWAVHQVRSRSEVTVVPHKEGYGPREIRVLREMLDRITPQDTVVTINAAGLMVNTPVTIRATASDSTYYQVEKRIEAAPELDSLPPPEMLPIDLQPGEDWLFNSRELAPYARFNITQEYGYFYLVSGGERSPIDSVTYSTLNDDGTLNDAEELEWYESSEQYGPWSSYEKADSPDNYPGGKFGLTPAAGPALTASRTPYQFPHTSQAEYVNKRKAEVLALGGQADNLSYRLPIERPTNYKRTYTADLAIAATAPTRDSTVTSSWTSRRTRTTRELRDTKLFVKS